MQSRCTLYNGYATSPGHFTHKRRNPRDFVAAVRRPFFSINKRTQAFQEDFITLDTPGPTNRTILRSIDLSVRRFERVTRFWLTHSPSSCKNVELAKIQRQGGQPMRLHWRKVFPLVIICLCAVQAMGCSPIKRLTVLSVGMILEDVLKASSKQTDVGLIGEGTPAYLMLLDGLI